MRLLNPTYDTVFKYLMQDLEIAKGLISRILDKEIIEITSLPQESTSIELQLKYISIPLLRQDFVAAIKTTDKQGNENIEKVMIEVQKSPFPPEVSRFRQYLSEKYHHKTIIDDEEQDLPIKTIYLIEKTFNSNLPSVLHVANDYYDRLTGIKYTGNKDQFVDLLVHEAYFIQTNLLEGDFKNDLMRVLSIFSTKYQINLGKQKRFIELNEEEINRYKDKLLSLIIRRLNIGTNDRKLLTALDVEIRYENEWDKMERKLLEERQKAEQTDKKLVQKDKELKQERQKAEQKDKELKQERQKAEQTDKKLVQKDKELKQERQKAEQKDKELKQERQKAEQTDKKLVQKDKELKQERQKLISTVKNLHKSGVSIDIIATSTGLSKNEINFILK